MGGILLISHGHFAEGPAGSGGDALRGVSAALHTACWESSDGPEEFSKKFDQAYAKAAQYGEVTVFCDLMGERLQRGGAETDGKRRQQADCGDESADADDVYPRE